MLSDYLKTSLRHMMKHKGIALMQMLGLSLGLLCCLLIYLYVDTECSYDRYHRDADRIFRIGLIWKFPTGQNPWTTIADPAVRTVRGYDREAEAVARVMNRGTRLVQVDEQAFYEPFCLMADPELFDILTIPCLTGDPRTALRDPDTVVLTRRMAKKYYHDTNPLGRLIRIGSREFEIRGILADHPRTTHLKYNFIMSIPPSREQTEGDWGNLAYITYLKLREGIDALSFEQKISAMADDKYDQLKESGTSHHYFLQPLKAIHLQSRLRRELEPPGNPTNLKILAGVGAFILIMTILNFTSLAAVSSSERIGEVGVRKILGARQGHLMRRFLIESGVMIVAATLAAFGLAMTGLSQFNSLASSGFETTDLFQHRILSILPVFILVVLIGGGLHPALVMASFGPGSMVRGLSKMGKPRANLRSLLVIGQFTIAVSMLVCTATIQRQIRFMSGRHPGFEKEQKLIIPVRGGTSIRGNYEAVKAEFDRHGTIAGVCVSSNIPGRPNNITGMRIEGSELVHRFNYYNVDADFMPLYGIELLAGRLFEKSRAANRQPIIINQAGLEKFGLGSPEQAVGKRVARGDFGEFKFEIIGVMRDIHIKGLQNDVEPFFLKTDPGYSYISLEVSPGSLEETITFTRRKWTELFPGVPFEYFFLDEEFDRQYSSEKRMAAMFRLFSGLGLFIAGSGLLGLVSSTLSRRTKEIAIRKVAGATAPGIAGLFMRRYFLWILAALMIGWPTSYLLMNHWLQNFAYRIELNIMLFLSAGAWALFIALLPVGFQSIKAASADPVDYLRRE